MNLKELKTHIDTILENNPEYADMKVVTGDVTNGRVEELWCDPSVGQGDLEDGFFISDEQYESQKEEWEDEMEFRKTEKCIHIG